MVQLHAMHWVSLRVQLIEKLLKANFDKEVINDKMNLKNSKTGFYWSSKKILRFCKIDYKKI